MAHEIQFMKSGWFCRNKSEAYCKLCNQHFSCGNKEKDYLIDYSRTKRHNSVAKIVFQRIFEVTECGFVATSH